MFVLNVFFVVDCNDFLITNKFLYKNVYIEDEINI